MRWQLQKAAKDDTSYNMVRRKRNHHTVPLLVSTATFFPSHWPQNSAYYLWEYIQSQLCPHFLPVSLTRHLLFRSYIDLTHLKCLLHIARIIMALIFISKIHPSNSDTVSFRIRLESPSNEFETSYFERFSWLCSSYKCFLSRQFII